ncbi:hypothetical protein [Ammoniphilus sp. YIM 78166]|nr:hypothetical protein [Ammoniphilus sp. YIM 78166]
MSINFIFFTLIIKKKKKTAQTRYEEQVLTSMEHKRNEFFSSYTL